MPFASYETGIIAMRCRVAWKVATDVSEEFLPSSSLLYSPYKRDYLRFKVITAVTMKNAVFWDIKTHFVPHRRHITSPLHSPAS
jgi:hypothetical protein